jgi:hypothetical protein
LARASRSPTDKDRDDGERHDDRREGHHDVEDALQVEEVETAAEGL